MVTPYTYKVGAKVVPIEDSAEVRDARGAVLQTVSGVEVVGGAADGRGALTPRQAQRPTSTSWI